MFGPQTLNPKLGEKVPQTTEPSLHLREPVQQGLGLGFRVREGAITLILKIQ